MMQNYSDREGKSSDAAIFLFSFFTIAVVIVLALLYTCGGPSRVQEARIPITLEIAT